LAGIAKWFGFGKISNRAMLKHAYSIAKSRIGCGKSNISKDQFDKFLNYYRDQYKSIGAGAFSD